MNGGSGFDSRARPNNGLYYEVLFPSLADVPSLDCPRSNCLARTPGYSSAIKGTVPDARVSRSDVHVVVGVTLRAADYDTLNVLVRPQPL